MVYNTFFTDLLIDYSLLGAKNDQYWLILYYVSGDSLERWV